MLYSSDFYAWTQAQAKFLKTRQWHELDVANLVEEVEALGRQERQELQNRLGVLLGHLLKWQYQPHNRSNSWRATIREQRRRIAQLLKESPSLEPFLQEAISRGYEDGLDLAVRETDQPYETFPPHCPFTSQEILEQDFLPENKNESE